MVDENKEVSKDNKSKKEIEPIIKFSVAAGIIWVLLLLFAIISFWTDFPAEGSTLSNAGSFFNIGTSLASFVTVVLVYSAYRLQRRELKEVSGQLKAQTQAAKDEEKINRAIKLFEEYISIFERINMDDKSLTIGERDKDIYNYVYRIIAMREKGFKNFIDFNVLIENLNAHSLESRMISNSKKTAGNIVRIGKAIQSEIKKFENFKERNTMNKYDLTLGNKYRSSIEKLEKERAVLEKEERYMLNILDTYKIPCC